MKLMVWMGRGKMLQGNCSASGWLLFVLALAARCTELRSMEKFSCGTRGKAGSLRFIVYCLFSRVREVKPGTW